MRPLILAAAVAALPLSMAAAQTATAPSVTLYELPGFLGRSVVITATTPDLATQGFARRAQSARIVGEWEICGAASYGGGCQSYTTSNQPFLRRAAVASLRPVGATADDGFGVSDPATDLDQLDAGEGVSGQDVSFFARPTLGNIQVSAGTNDLAAARAFCERAGFSGAAYASRARAQVSNIVDAQRGTRLRAFPLRDVLCRR